MSYRFVLQSSWLSPRPGGYADEKIQGDAGEGGTGEFGGHHAKGFAPVTESGQRPDSIELRRRAGQRETDAGRRRGEYPENQHAQDRPGQATLRRGRTGSRFGKPPRPAVPREKGRWRLRGARGGAQLQQAAAGFCPMVTSPAGRPRRRAPIHRQRVVRDDPAGSKKTNSNRGKESAG